MQSISGVNAAFSISDMINHMGAVQIGVWIFMLLMSIWMLAIVVERLARLGKAKKQNYSYVIALRKYLEQNRPDEAMKAAKAYDKSPIAHVISSGLDARIKADEAANNEGPDDVGEFDVVDAIHRAVDRSKERQTSGLRRGLGSLATIASAAPFVGLLGTVIGIIGAFSTMGESVTLEALGPKIGEALYATAFGLIVAIPAAMLFNYFTTRVEGYVVDMNEVSSEFMDYVLKEGRA